MNRDVAQFVDQWHKVSAEYTIAQQSRLQRKRLGVTGVGRSADYHYRLERALMLAIETARDDDRNNMVIGQGITRCVRNVLQGGITLDARTGVRALDREIEARWAEESNDESFSSTGEVNLQQQAELVLRSMIVDGDIFVLPRTDNTVQLVEAHRVRTPYNTKRNVVHGILFDDDARPQEYWVTKEDINPFFSVQNVSGMEKVAARDSDGNKQVLHVFNPKRVTQRRGFTALAPIALPTGMIDDIMIAKLVQQQAASAVTILTEVDANQKYPSKRTKKGEQATETLPDGTTKTIEGLACGLQLKGNPGEKLTGFSPNIPNPEFFPHARLTLSIIGLNLDLPLVVFLMDASETNFSGWRGAFDQAKIGFRALQRLLVTKFYRPIYKWKLRTWLSEDAAFAARVEAAGRDAAGRGKVFNVFRHGWNPPTWPYIQPMDDASAGILRRHGLLTSPRRLAAEDGLSWHEDVVAESIADNYYAISKAIKAAKKINARLTPEEREEFGVHWRDLLSLPMPDRVSLSMTESRQAGQEKPLAKPGKATSDKVAAESRQGILDYLVTKENGEHT